MKLSSGVDALRQLNTFSINQLANSIDDDRAALCTTTTFTQHFHIQPDRIFRVSLRSHHTHAKLFHAVVGAQFYPCEMSLSCARAVAVYLPEKAMSAMRTKHTRYHRNTPDGQVSPWQSAVESN